MRIRKIYILNIEVEGASGAPYKLGTGKLFMGGWGGKNQGNSWGHLDPKSKDGGKPVDNAGNAIDNAIWGKFGPWGPENKEVSICFSISLIFS